MTRKRKNYTPEEKVAILRRHLVEKAPTPGTPAKSRATFFYWARSGARLAALRTGNSAPRSYWRIGDSRGSPVATLDRDALSRRGASFRSQGNRL